MKLYSYIVTHDTGFAPNPFFGYCTLACCKPAIRRTANVGDWIVGLTPRADGNRIVFFMRVDEVLTFESYWRDPRFSQKKPRLDETVAKNGDNIYEPQPGGDFCQLPSRHSEPPFGKRSNSKLMRRDLGGKRVLVSREFAYFGSGEKALRLPRALECLIVGRGHRCRFSDDVKEGFLRFVRKQKRGVHAHPRHWPEGDESWKASSCAS